jgi:hypothetical protein
MTAPEKSGLAVIFLAIVVSNGSSASSGARVRSGGTGMVSARRGALLFMLLNRESLNPAVVGAQVEINIASEQAKAAIGLFIVTVSFSTQKVGAGL